MNNFYDLNAKAYFDLSINADMSQMHQLFLQKLSPGSRILDAGCGSGRDSKIFSDMGYKITAFDASAELATLASQHLGEKVFNYKFQDIPWENEFDAVWACASLLHLDDQQLDIAIKKLQKSLKKNGLFFASFKEGEGQAHDEKNRFFNYMNKEKLNKIFSEENGFYDLSIVETSDMLGRQQKWFNIFSRVSLKPSFKPKFISF